MNFENHSHCTHSHNTISSFSFIFCFVYKHIRGHIVSFNHFKIYYNNKQSKFVWPKHSTMCVGIYVVLIRLAAAVKHIRNPSNDTKMNNFRFIIVLLYTHITNESLFLLLDSLSIWANENDNKIRSTQFCSLYRQLIYSFTRALVTIKH